jgi:uncharacterized delta-60 repeat protein
VKTLALQSDGKIVVGGVFDSVGQIARQNIARLNADGTTDSNFNAQANGIVHSVVVQPNGKIVLAGRFTQVNGQVRNHIARLNADGTLDAAFDPNADGYVYAVALQTSGGLLAGGSFGSIGGGAKANLARLNPDGTLDTTYTPEAEHAVKALGLGQDGTLMVAGDFFTTPTSYSVLLLGNPTAATEGFQIDSSGTSATWARGGSSPEIVAATLESSVNGVQWASHGTGARVAEGWRWNANLQGKAYLRARGLQGYAGGWEGSGSGYFEVKILPGPTTFGEWKEAVLKNVGATETGDENNDGVPNLMEYALVLDPTRNNASPLTISVVADAMGSKHLCLGFRCDAHRSDVSIEVQAANNPSGPWVMIARSDNGGPFSGPGEVRVSNVVGSQSRLEVLDYLEVGSASTRFMRIRISH